MLTALMVLSSQNTYSKISTAPQFGKKTHMRLATRPVQSNVIRNNVNKCQVRHQNTAPSAMTEHQLETIQMVTEQNASLGVTHHSALYLRNTLTYLLTGTHPHTHTHSHSGSSIFIGRNVDRNTTQA